MSNISLDCHNQLASIERLAKKIAESGGKQRSKIWSSSMENYTKLFFCEDPML